MEDFKRALKDFVQQEAAEDKKLPSTEQEVHDYFVLFAAAQKSRFFYSAYKALRLSQQQCYKLFREYERSFSQELTPELKNDIIQITHALLAGPQKLKDYEIAQKVYEEMARQNGISRYDCNSYVKYCIKQIQKHYK